MPRFIGITLISVLICYRAILARFGKIVYVDQLTGTGHEFTGHPVLGFPVFLAMLQNGGQCLHSFTRFAVRLDGFFDKNRTFKRKIFTGFPNVVSTMPKYGSRKAVEQQHILMGDFLIYFIFIFIFYFLFYSKMFIQCDIYHLQ